MAKRQRANHKPGSAALRRGVPWADLREKYLDTKFEPSTHRYSSLVDAVTRNVDEMTAEMTSVGSQGDEGSCSDIDG